MQSQLDLFGSAKADILEKQKKARAKVFKGNAAQKRNKLLQRLARNKVEYQYKTSIDVPIINDVLDSLEGNQEMKLISDKFDSPSIVFAIQKRYGVARADFSTWAITDRGIDACKMLGEQGAKVRVLMDQLHSQKWIFSSGAYEGLKNVSIAFANSHCKFFLIETNCGKKITVSGSMNMSNNPRFENIDIGQDEATYNFYLDFFNRFFD